VTGHDPQRVAEAATAAMWADDKASQALGMHVDAVGPGRAVVSMTIRPDMTNGHGIGHGGFTFALADTAFAFACNSYDRRTVAARCDIAFLVPVREGDNLVADAVERHRAGRNGIYDITVRRGHDVVAEFRGTSREVGGPVTGGD
jgi:acyl-CoA thioesterase